jgi:hypothetical protein
MGWPHGREIRRRFEDVVGRTVTLQLTKLRETLASVLSQAANLISRFSLRRMNG